MVSAVLLAVFMVFQHFEAKALQLPAQWLAISAIPLIVALLVGGYISKFKGFGIELESRLQETVAGSSLAVSSVATELRGDQKRGLDYLLGLPQSARDRITRLTFFEGTEHGYIEEIVGEYLRELPKLEFVEVAREDGTFVCLIPVEVLEEQQAVEPERIRQLLESLRRGDTKEVFRGSAIATAIDESSSLISALQALRAERLELIPVVDGEGRFKGVAYSRDLERKIADDVLATHGR